MLDAVKTPDRVALMRKVTAVAIFVLLWELMGRSQQLLVLLGAGDLAERFPRAALFPPPSIILSTFLEMLTSDTRYACCDLVVDVGISLYRAILGWTLGGAVGIAVGLTSGRLQHLDHYLTPIVQIFRPLPPVAMIPVIILWFGIGEASKIFAIAMAVFFPVWINSYLGAKAIPRSYLWTARTIHLPALKVLLHVVLPSAMTNIVAGLRTGIAMAFVMVFVSELTGASAGLGYEINTSYLAYRMDRMMAALMLLGLLGWLADHLLTMFVSHVFPWLELQVQR